MLPRSKMWMTLKGVGKKGTWKAATVRQPSGLTRSSGSACSEAQRQLLVILGQADAVGGVCL